MSAKKIDVLRDVVLISFSDTSLWTGRAKLSAADLGLGEDEIPEEAVASLGSKRVIDPLALKPLNKNRYKMKRLCAELGMRFMGGYAVAEAEAEALVLKLDELVVEGEELKRRFLRDLDVKLEEWQTENARWQHILRAGTPAREKIAKKIQFGYTASMVSSPRSSVVARALNNSVDQIGGQLVDEVTAEARLFVNRSLTDGREKGSQKTVEPMRRLAHKVHSLRFMEPCLASMAAVLKRVLATIPSDGKVEADAFLNLTRVAHLIADRERFVETSQSLFKGEVTEDEVVLQLTGQVAGTQALPLEDAAVASEIAGLFSSPNAQAFEESEKTSSNEIGANIIANVLANVHAETQAMPVAPIVRRAPVTVLDF